MANTDQEDRWTVEHLESDKYGGLYTTSMGGYVTSTNNGIGVVKGNISVENLKKLPI